MRRRKDLPKNQIPLAVYRDKVLGCWTGKNCGGTLGTPFEGNPEMREIDFYTQELGGKPLPNDDLDLQLVWLAAVEHSGLYGVNERVLGEWWLSHVVGPWNEYGVGKWNMTNGLYPPLSGACNNERWKNSNGAWIRSEIWACLCAGLVNDAAVFARRDACVDHADDGIWAEVFTASLESAAFIESDINKLIDIALKKIPAGSEIAKAVCVAREAFEKGLTWQEARNLVCDKFVKIPGAAPRWFQAPANVAFVIVGLLWGGGDFGKSICIAVGCGDDTDCTGATCGAVLGIIKGRKGIPEKWTKPIGESIQTVAIDRFKLNAPETLEDLTDRVIAMKRIIDQENPYALQVVEEGQTIISESFRKDAENNWTFDRIRFFKQSSMEFFTPTLFGEIGVKYDPSPIVAEGESVALAISIRRSRANCRSLRLRICGKSYEMPVKPEEASYITIELSPKFEAGESFVYIPLELKLSDHNCPEVVMVPFQRKGSTSGAENMYYNLEEVADSYRILERV